MQTERDFQRWLRGEFRTDGQQSQWLKDTLKARAMEAQRAAVPAAPIKLVIRPRLVCKNCPAEVSRMSLTGLCRKCGARRVPKKTCMYCTQELRKVNTTGRCMKHKFLKEAA